MPMGTMRGHLGCTLGVTLLIMAGCGGPAGSGRSGLQSAEGQAQRTVAPVQEATRKQGPPSKTELEEIRALVEELAISDQPAAMAPVYTPSIDTPRTDKRVIAFEAAKEIKRYGKKAFPVLLDHLDDGRQSVAFRAVLPCTVGLACRCIIEDMVLPLPTDYQGSYYRTGADGEMHERPRFLRPSVFGPDTVESWLKAREGKTLEEIQVETLEWLIGEEKKIGFQSGGDRRRYLDPLERELRRVKKLVQAQTERRGTEQR